jgi:hypothetical protein
MRESIVVICPTVQAEMRAAIWHDGQIRHGWHARIARRITIRALQERIGRPLGDDRFLARIERRTGRDLKPGKRGPKSSAPERCRSPCH